MVTLNKITKTRTENDKTYIVCEIYGLSTDTKPTSFKEDKVDNGSVYIAIDTQDVYFYDLENTTWGDN